MSRGWVVVALPQFAAVCELQLWREPFLSWLVSSVSVRIVVPLALSRVLSVGLSVVMRRYCAVAGAARQRRTIDRQARMPSLIFIETSLERNQGFRAPRPRALLQDGDDLSELSFCERASDEVNP